jgi:hypothetical protein
MSLKRPSAFMAASILLNNSSWPMSPGVGSYRVISRLTRRMRSPRSDSRNQHPRVDIVKIVDALRRPAPSHATPSFFETIWPARMSHHTIRRTSGACHELSLWTRTKEEQLSPSANCGLNLMAASLLLGLGNSRTGRRPAARRRAKGASLTCPDPEARIIHEIYGREGIWKTPLSSGDFLRRAQDVGCGGPGGGSPLRRFAPHPPGRAARWGRN